VESTREVSGLGFVAIAVLLKDRLHKLDEVVLGQQHTLVHDPLSNVGQAVLIQVQAS